MKPDDVLVTTVARLALDPGDVVCIRINSNRPADVDRVSASAKRVFPDHQVLILGPETDVFVVEEGSAQAVDAAVQTDGRV